MDVIVCLLSALLLAVGILPAPTGGGSRHGDGSGATCLEETATIVGTPGTDLLTGTDGADVIVGLGGDDEIEAGPGNDVVCGGRGTDTLSGGAGSDRISGGPGSDEIDGGSGADACFGDGSGASVDGCDPLIGAAGDVACDPGDPSFNDGAGTSSACRMSATSNLLVRENLAAVLPLGDLQYEDGGASKFEVSYDPSWGRLRSVTRPSPGNHDYGTPGAAGYFGYFGDAAGDADRGYYSSEVGEWHLVALNSNCWAVGGCGSGSPQLRWLKTDLAAHPAECTLAYWHHPRFSSGPHGNDRDVGPLWHALVAAGADVVLNGHDHHYERFAPQDASGLLDRSAGIREFVVGTGGESHYGFVSVQPNSRSRNASAFGVLLLSLHPAGYDWRFVPVAGSSFTDLGHGRCH